MRGHDQAHGGEGRRALGRGLGGRSIDRDRLKYLLEDFQTRPERVRWAKRIGAVAGVFFLAGIILLLTMGKPRPEPKAKTDKKPVAAASAGVQDAFAYAKVLEAKFRENPACTRIYLVPSAANQQHRAGKVVVMGEIATEADLLALQTAVSRDGIPVTLEWQVAVSQAGLGAPPVK